MSVNYLEKKQELISLGYDWIQAFDENIDDFAFKVLKDEVKEESPHSYFLVESNLTEMSRCLDKVLTFRRAANDLEDRAVRQALEYQLYNQNFGLVKKLEKQEWNAEIASVEAAKSADIKSTFEKSEHPLASGFSASANASNATAVAFAAAEEKRKMLVQTKWDNVDVFTEALQSRHNQSGHALNYRQRSDRLRALLKEELLSAYRLGKSVSNGLQIIFKFKKDESEIPKLVQSGYIDELVFWTGEKIREFNLLKERETVFEHVVSTRTTKRGDGSVIYTGPQWTAAINRGEFEFDLSNYFPKELSEKGLRVLGIDVAIKVKEIPKHPQYKYFFTSALVYPPKQKDPNSSSIGAGITKPPVILERVSLLDGNTTANFYTGNSITNLNPTTGIWKVKIPKNLEYYYPNQRAAKDYIWDIALVLLLAFDPSDNSSGYETFWH